MVHQGIPSTLALYPPDELQSKLLVCPLVTPIIVHYIIPSIAQMKVWRFARTLRIASPAGHVARNLVGEDSPKRIISPLRNYDASPALPAHARLDFSTLSRMTLLYVCRFLTSSIPKWTSHINCDPDDSTREPHFHSPKFTKT